MYPKCQNSRAGDMKAERNYGGPGAGAVVIRQLCTKKRAARAVLTFCGLFVSSGHTYASVPRCQFWTDRRNFRLQFYESGHKLAPKAGDIHRQFSTAGRTPVAPLLRFKMS